MNNHMKSVFKICGILGLICVLCVLCCLPFVNFTDCKVEVHADTIFYDTVFDSSNYYCNLTLYSSSDNSPQVNSNYQKYNTMLGFTFDSRVNIAGLVLGSNNSYFGSTFDFVYDEYVYKYMNYSGGRFMFHFHCDSGFNSHVVKIYVDTRKWGGTNNDIAQTFFDFTDENGKRCSFYFFSNFTADGNNALTYNNIIWYLPRTYFLTTSLSDNEYFSQGQFYGEQIGEERGFRDGRAKGYDDGKKDGIEIGKELGTDYSFVSFFTGLFDAPVAMVYNALDFELLGVNLYDFFCGLITVFLCLALIRFIRGK